MNNPSFHLMKWYLDVTTEKGECFIGYAATLRWRRISMGYKGFIYLDSKGAVRKSNTFRSLRLPEIKDNDVVWRTSFGHGRWQNLHNEIAEMLLNTDKGWIDWHCVGPKVKASFQMIDGKPIEGLGYVEKMELTLPPWQIPIDTLCWGRYVSESYSLIWIEWKGAIPKIRIFLNGNGFEHGIIDNRQISFGDFTLNMETGTTLRAGSIGSTIFARFKSIMVLFPLSIFKLRENKWTGKATLLQLGKAIDNGYYIHEEVHWK
jgi:hypothetical protein